MTARPATDIPAIQRRTVALLFFTQIIAGVGLAVGASVGTLLAADLAGVGLSGVTWSASVVGGALFAVPGATIVERSGRRLSLAAGYALAALGALLVVVAAIRVSVPLLVVGFFLLGGGTAAGYQARYAALDLAPAELRGRHLSLVMWATTLGAVAGPSLAAPAGVALDRYGVPTLAGPFGFAALLFTFATLVLLLLLRPDPAAVARETIGATLAGSARARGGVRAALPVVLSHASARLGVCTMAVGHVVMVGVMTMTPVHIRNAGHDAAATLRIVGLILSSHVAGMFAFAPVFGWLTDRIGRRPVIGVGIVLLVAACALAGTAEHHTARLAQALLLLGLGWSATIVAGSTLLSEGVPAELRPAAQGLSDLTTGLAGAIAGSLSGVVVAQWSYATLTLVAAIATVPLVPLLLGRTRAAPA
jgi:MFS family permease